jgi:membrane glycosyltransferase
MFGIFTKHPKTKNLSYWQHLTRALLMGAKLLISGACFILHAVFPFIPIPKKYNCHDMVHSLVETAGWRR